MADDSLTLLLVEDDEDFRDTSARWMQRKGHDVVSAASGAEALALCMKSDFEVGIFDMNMPGMSGIELLQRLRDSDIEMEVIILTGQGTIESAVQAMKLGACDYITKPCSMADLEHRCFLARERLRLRKENQQLKQIIARTQPKAKFIGESPSVKEVQRWIQKVAPTDKPVLILGESGTGKEVVARSIQEKSVLAKMPFVTINCAALPEQLVESELFGHQKGAFTGATAEKPGLFEVADGGTLFIDELGELPLSLQPKLLRVLEDGSMRRVGSHKERVVRVRVIAATNCDLANAVKAGKFREDLYFRVNVFPITLAPLRQRASDIPLLVQHFLPPNWKMDDEVLRAMMEYRWPGNIRELINILQRAMILADHHVITMADIPREILTDKSTSDERVPEQIRPIAPSQEIKTEPLSELALDRLEDISKAHVLDVLKRQNGNKARAARMLGIHRRKLYRLLERFQQNDKEGSSGSFLQEEKNAP